VLPLTIQFTFGTSLEQNHFKPILAQRHKATESSQFTMKGMKIIHVVSELMQAYPP